jgi:galactonate dehydratase
MRVVSAKIIDVDIRKDYRMVLRPGEQKTTDIYIVKLETDEGIYGVGEMALAYAFGGKGCVAAAGEFIENFVLNADPFEIELIWNRMYRNSFWAQGGGPIVFAAVSAIDEALWDIKGKALKVSVAELLGGMYHKQLRFYCNGWYRNIVEPEEYGQAAAKCLEEHGYRALKFDPFAVHLSGEYRFPDRVVEDRQWLKTAVERVAAVRAAVGDEVDIMIEIHGNLGVMEAVRFGQMIEEYAPYFYEEPVEPGNVDAMQKVADKVNIPIAAGERLYTRYGFRDYIERQVLDVIQPDIGLCGGLTEARKICSYADTYHITCQPHNCGGPISTAVAVQLDASLPNFLIQECFPFAKDCRYDIVKNPLEHQIRNGVLQIPHAAGLGVELNEDCLRRFDVLNIGRP